MREVRWHVVARWVWVAMLAAAAVVAKHRGHLPHDSALLVICACMAAYNLAFTLFPPRGAARVQSTTLLSLVADTIGLTVYLYYSGGIESPLRSAYVFPVIGAAVMLSMRTGLLLAACAAIQFAFLVGSTSYGWPIRLPHHHLELAGEFSMEEADDPAIDPRGRDYVRVRTLWVFLELFGAAYGFGMLAQRVRQKERALLAENEQLTGLLNAFPVGVAILAADGRILMQNPVVTNLLGDIVGCPVSRLDPGLGLSERLGSLDTAPITFESCYKDRVLDHVLAHVSRDGRVVWIVRDSTEPRRMEARMVHQAKMADLGLLAAGIAHEIGNPLSTLSAILQILLDEPAAPESGERLRTLMAQVQRIQRILESVTSFACPSAGKRTRLPIGTMMEAARTVFQFHEKSKRVCTHISGGNGPDVEVVEDQIVQVLLNLLLNAADASSAGGTIHVGVGCSSGEAIAFVRDGGPGIPGETLQHLFVPFHTTKDPGKGMGLGLFVSETIVRAHGGRIEVRTEVGKGSTFTVCLPIAGK